MDTTDNYFSDFGVSPLLESIYFYLFKNGASKNETIVSDLKLSQLLFITSIEELLTKDLVYFVQKNNEQYFVARSFSQVIEIFNKQKENVNNAYKKIVEKKAIILGKQKSGVPKIRLYEGKNALKSMIDSEFFTMKSKVAYSIYPYKEVKNLFSNEEKEIFRQKRISQKIHLKVIRTLEEADPSVAGLSEQKIIDHAQYPISAEIDVSEDRIIIADLKDTYTGIVIENKAIAKTFNSLFSLLWEKLE